MARRRMSSQGKMPTSNKEKLERLERLDKEWTGNETTTKTAWLTFFINQEERGNSKATLDYYRRFYKKLIEHYNEIGSGELTPINWIEQEGSQLWFTKSLGNVNQQTINSYLRAYRAFGNFCYEQGYIGSFKCPIKEIEPEAKQVYTDKELQRLTVKPSIDNFEEFRNFAIISLILATGARCNTILNIKIEDVELDEGYIRFNTTKAHKVVRIGLERKIKHDLKEFIFRWRSIDRYGYKIPKTDYLFCNTYGEQLTRGGLTKAIANYNKKRGVLKTSIHLLRHTYAKNWITSGGDIISLAKVLTHSELDMVKRYSNLYGEDVKAEIEQHSTLSQLKRRSGSTMRRESI